MGSNPGVYFRKKNKLANEARGTTRKKEKALSEKLQKISGRKKIMVLVNCFRQQ